MITFYSLKNDVNSEEIEDVLKETKTAHEVITVEDKNDSRIPKGKQPPLLVHDQQVVQGAADIFKYLQELKEYEKQWYKFQSDACYTDDEGNVQ